MSEGAGNTGFETQLAEYKEMVKLRQEECVKIAELLETESRVLSGRAKQLKMALIVLGVIVATKGGLEAAMTDFGAGPGTRVVLGLAFLIFGAVISVIAGIEAGFRFESRDKRHIDPANPEVTLAKLGALIDLQNESLDHIRHRSDNLSVDLSAVKVSYRLSDPGQNRAAPV
jgi:hypothetical protein